VIGQIHRLTPKYMFDYTSEVAWREDMRRSPPCVQVRSLLSASLKKPSLTWPMQPSGRDFLDEAPLAFAVHPSHWLVNTLNEPLLPQTLEPLVDWHLDVRLADLGQI